MLEDRMETSDMYNNLYLNKPTYKIKIENGNEECVRESIMPDSLFRLSINMLNFIWLPLLKRFLPLLSYRP